VKDEHKTKERLINELVEVRQRITELEASATEHRRVEDKLKSSEERLSILFKFAPDAYYLSDLKGNFVDGNKAAEEMIGYKRGELIGKNFLKLRLLPPKQIPKAAALLAKNVMGQSTGPSEFILNRQDGSQVVAEIRTFPVKIRGKTLVLGIARDITERKRAEEELRAAQEYTRNLIDSSMDMIISVDQDRKIVEFNQAAQKTYSYTEAEVVGRHADMLYADPSEGSKVHEDTYRTGQFIGEVTNRRKDGEIFPSFLAASVMRDENGEFVGLMGISRDITERKRAEEKLIQLNRELSALNSVLISITRTLDLGEVLKEVVSQVGIALESPYTSIAIANDEGDLEIGCEAFRDVPPLFVRPQLDGVITGMVATGEPIVIDNTDVDEGADPTTVAAGIKSYAGVLIRTKDKTIGALFTHSMQRNAFRDRMDLLLAFANQAAIAIENARLYKEASTIGALREADRLKTELLANVSHELRTPLASVKGYCRSMLRNYEKLTDEEKRDSLDEINQASDRLTELIENLLQLSKFEAGGFSMQKEFTNIAYIIRQAVDEIRQRAQKHHFATQLPHTLPMVEIDAHRIRQVLDNLLNNAVSYSSEGTEISVQCESKEGEVVISIQDQGVGISSQEIDRVFDRFYRAASGQFEKIGGVGLGLAICKHIVEAHRGRIWAESALGQGSTFIFTLPLMAEKSEDEG